MLSVCNQIKWNQIKLKSTLSLLKCASKSSSSSSPSARPPRCLPRELSLGVVSFNWHASQRPAVATSTCQSKVQLGTARKHVSHTHTPTPRPGHSQPACCPNPEACFIMCRSAVCWHTRLARHSEQAPYQLQLQYFYCPPPSVHVCLSLWVSHFFWQFFNGRWRCMIGPSIW